MNYQYHVATSVSVNSNPSVLFEYLDDPRRLSLRVRGEGGLGLSPPFSLETGPVADAPALLV